MTDTPENVWVFLADPDHDMRKRVHDSLQAGKSRFGFSRGDDYNLRGGTWTDEHSKNLFLLQAQLGDWIVHVNIPETGQCQAAPVVSDYGFDEGLPRGDGDSDFRHYFDIDVQELTRFHRKDPNVLPSVNLSPRRRQIRVKDIPGFVESIRNIREGTVHLSDDESRNEYHLKSKTRPHLGELIELVHKFHPGKNLERYIAKVFGKIPEVTQVIENGSQWGTDHGADLIVIQRQEFAGLEFEHSIVVQVKSFTGSHYDTGAVEQLKNGIAHFGAHAGLLVTTGQKTDELERAIGEASTEARPISILAGDDLARFIIKYAPECLFSV